MGETEILNQLLIGRSLFERVKTFAMDVLNQGLLKGAQVVDVSNNRGNCR